jgi:membrane-bound lytic murein transglycosylase B
MAGFRSAAGALTILLAGLMPAMGQTTGAISTSSPPKWSGESGASGDPSMSAEAIKADAANFHQCLNHLWPLAAKRHVSRATYVAATKDLTPDLRIMDLMDNQPEFTKSFWD